MLFVISKVLTHVRTTYVTYFLWLCKYAYAYIWKSVYVVSCCLKKFIY